MYSTYGGRGMQELPLIRDPRSGEYCGTLPVNVFGAFYWWARGWDDAELDAFAAASKEDRRRFRMRTRLRAGERPLLVVMRVGGRTFGFPPVARTPDGKYVLRLPPDTFLAFFRVTGHDASEIYDDDVRLRLHRRGRR